MGGMNAPHYGPLQAELNGPGIVAPAFFLPLCTEVLRRRILGSSPPALCIATDLHRAVFLEVPSIGWQLFILESYQSDSTAFPSCLDTYATRLLTEPLSAWNRNPRKFVLRNPISGSLYVRLCYSYAPSFPCLVI